MTTRHAQYLVAAALVALPAGAAFAQSSTSQTACFEVVASASETQPAGAILLNRCTGQTWILVRTYQPSARGNPVYRWSAIAGDAADPKPPPAAPVAATSDKCFIFQGRRFCE
jgi:hypothetical protein